jgi:hypothetical protein
MNGTPLSARSDNAADDALRIAAEFALLATGEPVELIHLEEDAHGRRALVETMRGRRMLVDPEALVALPLTPTVLPAEARTAR